MQLNTIRCKRTGRVEPPAYKNNSFGISTQHAALTVHTLREHSQISAESKRLQGALCLCTELRSIVRHSRSDKLHTLNWRVCAQKRRSSLEALRRKAPCFILVNKQAQNVPAQSAMNFRRCAGEYAGGAKRVGLHSKRSTSESENRRRAGDRAASYSCTGRV